MELHDKVALAVKNFAKAKEVHDDMAAAGARCGSWCDMFHKDHAPTVSKEVDDARVFKFLHDIGRRIN